MPTKETIHKCSYCGKRNKSVSMHSGVYECHACWMWRKVDGPAARHWSKVTREFLSNIDLYDYQSYFPNTLGISREDMDQCFTTALKILVNSDHARALHERENRFRSDV